MDLKEFLDFKLLDLSKYTITVGNMLLIIAILVGTWIVLGVVKKAVNSSKKLDQGQKYSIFQIIKYLVWIFAIAYCFESLGIKFSFLLAGSAALLVGLGLGLQQTFNDFVSGIILLFEGTIKVGDVIEVDGNVARVQHIGMRTTRVMTREDITLILPNNQLTNQKVINWSHAHEKARFYVSVGVEYGSDVELVRQILLDSVNKHEGVMKDPKPFVRFEDFGNSSLDFSVFFWSDRIFPIEDIKSDLRFEIDKRFREKGVTIPFPQRVVHFATKLNVDGNEKEKNSAEKE